jgi:hypothetical protein
MLFERVLDDRALNALAPPMHDSDCAEPRPKRHVDVLLDDRRHVARLERVEIKLAFDGNGYRLGHKCSA